MKGNYSTFVVIVVFVGVCYFVNFVIQSTSGPKSPVKESFDADLVAYKQKLLRSSSMSGNVTRKAGYSHHSGNFWNDIRDAINLESLDAMVKRNLDYNKKSPFPHLVEDNFFPESVLLAAIDEIPDNPKLKKTGCIEGSSKCFDEKTQKFKNAFDRYI